MFKRIKQALINWITAEPPNTNYPLCDFERIRYEVRPCDVLLIEGRSRVSNVIKQITQSPWSHSCIYIGRLHDVDDINLRKKLAEHFNGAPNVQLVIEGYLGKGTIVSPLESYHSDHIRICRPRGLARKDAQDVIAYAINQLGTEYDVRQIFDLARFLVPWAIMPGRWRSSLFKRNVGETTKTVCSTMIANAFGSVEFPILPVIKQHEETGIELVKRNPKLFTPSDFDYSPFFEIIKYPFIELGDHGNYRNLPWNRNGLISPDGESIVEEEDFEPILDSNSTSKEKEPDSDNVNKPTLSDADELLSEQESASSDTLSNNVDLEGDNTHSSELDIESDNINNLSQMASTKTKSESRGILQRLTPIKKLS